MDVVRHRPRVRLIAGLLACAWVLLPVGTLIDALVAEHVYCAEHNAIEHAGDAASPASAPATPGGEDRLAAGTAAATGHGDACAFAQMTTRATRAPENHTVTAALPAFAAEPAAVESDAPPLPILAFAPKSSPPA